MRQIRRQWLVPETVLASVSDSGPAVVCSLLRGYGRPAALGRLRAACRREFDGSDMSQLGQLIQQEGFATHRFFGSPDFPQAPQTSQPLLVEVNARDQDRRFVLIWRRLGDRVLIMDSAVGRRWIEVAQLTHMLGRDTRLCDARQWRQDADTASHRVQLDYGLSRLGVRAKDRNGLLEKAFATTDWMGPAGLDAVIRLTHHLKRAGGLGSREQVTRALQRLMDLVPRQVERQYRDIPREWWRTLPSDEDPQQLICQGKWMLAVAAGPEPAPTPQPKPKAEPNAVPSQTQPMRYLIQLSLREARWVTPIYFVSLLWHVLMTVIEALIFRGFLDMSAQLALDQRLGAVTMIVVFLTLVLAQLYLIGVWRLAVGNRLEARIRMAYMEKIPRLGEANMGSMTPGDMAERGHGIRSARDFPRVFSHVVNHAAELTTCIGCLIWLDPAVAPHAVTAALIVLVAPLIIRPVLEEPERRLHTHGGRLSHLFLDALKGLIAFRVHGAERALNRTYEAVLTRWVAASRRFESLSAVVEGLLSGVGYALAAWLTLTHLSHNPKPGAMLLFLFWSLRIPAQTQHLITAIKNLLTIRNRIARLLEVLELPESGDFNLETPLNTHGGPQPGFSMRIENLGVRWSGHQILHDLTLDIKGGEHIAVVGPSGSGKSTLTQILLGAQQPTGGRLLLDGVCITQADPRHGNRAWVAPGVKLWNRTLLENLVYGTHADADHRLGEVIENAMLEEVIAGLPDGLQTRLGEGGCTLSGGQAQRVRLGRAMLQRHARLVILDEAFRGLDQKVRHELMLRVKAWWPEATLLFITHNVQESLFFPRVLVIESGRLVEDGDPASLQADPHSKLSGLLSAHQQVEREVWGNPAWRRLVLERGAFRAEV